MATRCQRRARARSLRREAELAAGNIRAESRYVDVADLATAHRNFVTAPTCSSPNAMLVTPVDIRIERDRRPRLDRLGAIVSEPPPPAPVVPQPLPVAS